MSSKPSTSSTSASSPSASSPAPAPAQSTTASGSGSGNKPKPHNVFSNDGSFMERFKSMKQGGAQSDKQEGKLKMNQALQRKKAMEDRIRNRGKRIQSPTENEGEEGEGETDSKNKKRKKDGDEDENETDVYLREVRKLERSTLKDSGSGVRSLVK